MVRRGHGDRIDILPLEQAPIIRIKDGAWKFPRGGPDAERTSQLHLGKVFGVRAAIAMINIAEGDYIMEDPFTADADQIIPSLSACADAGYIDPATGRDGAS
jgi:hypothetical protein